MSRTDKSVAFSTFSDEILCKNVEDITKKNGKNTPISDLKWKEIATEIKTIGGNKSQLNTVTGESCKLRYEILKKKFVVDYRLDVEISLYEFVRMARLEELKKTRSYLRNVISTVQKQAKSGMEVQKITYEQINNLHDLIIMSNDQKESQSKKNVVEISSESKRKKLNEISVLKKNFFQVPEKLEVVMKRLKSKEKNRERYLEKKKDQVMNQNNTNVEEQLSYKIVPRRVSSSMNSTSNIKDKTVTILKKRKREESTLVINPKIQYKKRKLK